MDEEADQGLCCGKALAFSQSPARQRRAVAATHFQCRPRCTIIKTAHATPDTTCRRSGRVSSALAPLRRRAVETISLGRESGDDRSAAIGLRLLGTEVLRQGEFGAARDFLEQALGLWRALGSQWHVAGLLASLRINVEMQDRTGCVASLVAVAAVHVAAGETGPATRLLRTAQTWLAGAHEPLPQLDQIELERLLAATKADADVKRPVPGEIRSLSLDEIVRYSTGDWLPS